MNKPIEHTDDKILLKIKRDFTESEAVAVLQKELTSVKIKNGGLLSDISELKDQNQKLIEQLAELKKKKNREQLIDERLTEYQERLCRKGNRIQVLEKQLKECQNKNITLERKIRVEGGVNA